MPRNLKALHRHSPPVSGGPHDMSGLALWPSPLEFDAAIAAHRMWLRHLEFAIAGIETGRVDMTSIADPARCPLGQWLADLPDDLASAEVHALEATHARLHEALERVASLMERGGTAEAERVFAAIATPLSATLCNQLAALKQRVATSPKAFPQ